MVKKSTGDISDNVLRDHIDNLQEESQESIIILSVAPTAGTPLLDDGQAGQFGTSFYHRVGNTIYVFASSSQITIT